MGLCGTKSRANIDIEDEIKSSKKDVCLKLLLIGAGESGKTTIAKQIKILHMNGFSEAEILTHKLTIYQNLIQAIQDLIHGAQQFEYQFSKDGKESAMLLQNLTEESLLDPDVVEAIKCLWSKEPSIHKTFARVHEFQFLESGEYFLNHIDRITNKTYNPSYDDILRARAKTTGIIEMIFELKGVKYKLVDVGGQRSERRKWLHCFQDVTAIIFCVSLSEYDQMLLEDSSVRRTHESMKLFEEICNSKWFGDVQIILFFNKYDLFQQKIRKVDLKVAFSDYSGGPNLEKAQQFIMDKYLGLNRNEGKKIYTHTLTATDSSSVENSFSVVTNEVLKDIAANHDLDL